MANGAPAERKISAVGTSNSAARPAGPPRSRSSYGQQSSDARTAPSKHSTNTHPYAAITSSSGTLTRSNSVPASPSWVPSHKGSRSLSSMSEQPRPLPVPPPPAGEHAPRAPVARGHRRADSLPFIFPSTSKHSSVELLAKLPKDPAQWTHGELLLWLEASLIEAGLAKPVVRDVLAWLGQSRPVENGIRVGGLALNGREFLKGETGAWATTGQGPPFHTLLFQLSKSLSAGPHRRQASTVIEADEGGDETPVERLVRGWEERSSSGASEAGSDDDDDDIYNDVLESPSARKSRESERRYRRRSSMQGAEAAMPILQLGSNLPLNSTCSTADDAPPSDAELAFNPAPDSLAAPDGPVSSLPSGIAASSKRSERKSYDGLGSTHEGPAGKDREERRIMTIKPRKSSGTPSLGMTSFSPDSVYDLDIDELARLRALVVTLSDRMRTLESRLDSLEAVALTFVAADDVVVKPSPEADATRRPDRANAMTLRQLPGFLCLASLGLGIIVWGVLARSRRGGRL